MVKMKVTGMTLSVSGTRRKSIRGRMGGVRFQFCAKPQILHRETQFLSSLRNMTAAAAAAKSLQSCPTLCDPIDGSPPGSAIPGILQARTLEWVAISFSNA